MGDNFGELCVTITVYTTDEDREQFEPIKLNKRNCVSDPDLTAREMRKFAEEEAIVEAVLDYKRSLEGQARDKLLNLLQRVNYLESGMLPDTDTYCVRVEGYVTPIEAVALLQSAPEQESPEQATSTYDDEFDGPTLNPNWYWQKEDPSQWSLDTTPGRLQIVVSGGDLSFSCNNYQNLLLQNAPETDFEIQTRVYIQPTQNYHQGGLIIFHNHDNYIKLEVLWADDVFHQTSTGIELVSEQNGEFIPTALEQRFTELKLDDYGIFLRLKRQGNRFDGSYSINGESWVQLGSISAPTVTSPQIGILALGGAISTNNAPNCPHGALGFPVDFDYFRVSEVTAPQTVNQQSAHIRWITSQPQNSCDNICNDADLTAVSPGSNQDGTFYVCRIHEDNRSGFNIPMADIWDQCLVGYGGIERIDDQFDCLCAEQ